MTECQLKDIKPTDSPDLQHLKSIEHPCGHFDKALKEIDERDQRIIKLTDALNSVIGSLDAHTAIINRLALAIQEQSPHLTIQLMERQEASASQKLNEAIKSAKHLIKVA